MSVKNMGTQLFFPYKSLPGGELMDFHVVPPPSYKLAYTLRWHQTWQQWFQSCFITTLR